MIDITPLFETHFSLSGSLLTVDEPGKAKPGAAVSVFDLAGSVGLKEVTIVDGRLDSFLPAYRTASKLDGVKLIYGLKLVVCTDASDKTPESKRTESKVIVFIKDSAGYSDLIKVWNRAWTSGLYSDRFVTTGRTDWTTLKSLWTSNLMLGLSYYSSFLQRNALTMSKVVPDLPPATPLLVMREIGSQLPFDPLIDIAIDRFAQGRSDVQIVASRSVYYACRADFKAYVIKRCVGMKSSFDKPEVDHLASDRFSFETWKELTSRS